MPLQDWRSHVSLLEDPLLPDVYFPGGVLSPIIRLELSLRWSNEYDYYRHCATIEYVVFDADSSVYGGNLLFNVNCSSGTVSLSNQQVNVKIPWVTVESRCNGTGILNQQVSRRNVIDCRLASSQLCHIASKF